MSATRWRLKIAAGAVGMLLFGVAIYNYCSVYCREPYHLKVSGGNVSAERAKVAERIGTMAQAAGVVLEFGPGSNSEDICRAVNDGRLNLGIVLGGFLPGQHPNVRQVAALGVDPLHLLVRKELIRDESPSLEMLRGRRVLMGERGTNGARLAENLIDFAGLKASSAGGDLIPEYVSADTLREELVALRTAAPADRAKIRESLPDAVFLVVGIPSPIVDQLVQLGGYRLVSLPYAKALHLDARRDHLERETLLESSRLEATKIPAYTYGIQPAVPATDCETFGLRLLLIANKDTPAPAIAQLLESLEESLVQHYHGELHVTEHGQEFPLHVGAQAYAEGRKPLMVGEMLEPVGNALSVIGAGGAGALALWGFLRGLRAVNPDKHLRQIDHIERLLRGDEHDDRAPALPHEFIDYLERRLADVKKAAIDDYAAGRLDGDEALVSILTLVADTRQLLMERRNHLAHYESPPGSSGRRLSSAA